jgi:hypothetical protein
MCILIGDKMNYLEIDNYNKKDETKDRFYGLIKKMRRGIAITAIGLAIEMNPSNISRSTLGMSINHDAQVQNISHTYEYSKIKEFSILHSYNNGQKNNNFSINQYNPLQKFPNLSTWWLYIHESAKEYNIDPFLIAAIVKAESNGNDMNKSKLKHFPAIGLMQIRGFNVNFENKRDLFKPDININEGTRLYHDYLLKFNGNENLAIAAYNVGPQNIIKNHYKVPKNAAKYVLKVKKYREEITAQTNSLQLMLR